MKKILVVDDSFTVRKVIEMLLVPLGYELTFAEKGSLATEIAKNTFFPIAVVDYSLPDMTGLDLAKVIKSNAPKTKILLMKSAKEDVDATRVVDDVISKPFDSQTMISKLEALSEMEEPEVVVTEEKPKDEFKLTEEDFKIDLEVGEEFSFEPKKIEEKAEKKTDIEEEIAEIADIELIEDVDVSGTKEEKIEVEEVSLEDLLEESEIKIEEEKIFEEPVKKEDTGKVSIDELFADLNEILADNKEPSAVSEQRPTYVTKDVKPVVEELAKDLKELENITKEEAPKEADVVDVEELDLWDFIPEEEKKEEPKPVTVEKHDIKEETLSPVETDRASLEKLIREITYEVVEKIAWEVVPEVVDAIMKDKFGKK